MAGSLKYFVYTDGFGRDWAIWRDESNTEAVNGGTQDYSDATPDGIIYKLPPNIKPRYLRYVSADGTVSKNIVCLTTTIFNGAPIAVKTIADPNSGLTLNFVEAVGERIKVPFARDTGLADGDAT